MFHDRMPMSAKLCICLMITSINVTIVAILDLGSRPILKSAKIHQKMKYWVQCKWSRKFTLSCPLIALRVGEFHQMDRDRGP